MRGAAIALVAIGFTIGARAESLGPETVVGTVAGESITLAVVDEAAHGAITRLLADVEASRAAALERLLEGGRLEGASIERLPSADAGHAAWLPETVLARLDGRAIRAADVESAARLPLFRARGRIVSEARRRFAELADRRLLERESARRGVSTDALLAAAARRAAPVADAEVAEAQRGQGDEAAAERIREHLEFRRRHAIRMALLEPLRAATPPVFLLTMPEPPRFPELGQVEPGTLTIVVFTNARCTLCAETERVVASLERDPPVRPMRVVRRHLFPRAVRATWGDALAEECIAEQGQADALRAQLRAALDAPASAPVDATSLARRLAADRAAFDRCLTSGETRRRVQGDLRDAEAIGLTSTPSFLVNGLALVGFQGRERLVEVAAAEAAKL